MMGIFSLVSFRSGNILSLELFLHALLEGTDFSTLKFCILKCLRNDKNRNNQFSFSTGGSMQGYLCQEYIREYHLKAHF